MNSVIKKSAEVWIKAAAADSVHPYDMNRFYDLIFKCIELGETIDYEEIKTLIHQNLKWNEEYVVEFAKDKAILAEKIIGFIDYLKSERQINVYNLL